MPKLATSILSADFYKLGIEIEGALNLGVDWIHIDVMDGHFVHPLTYGSKIVEDIKKNNKNIFCDVHLMVSNPENIIPQFIKADADIINFHYEATKQVDELISIIKKNKKLAGITIKPETPVNLIESYLSKIDLVLVMSVNPGYSNQKCIKHTLDKISALKEIKEKNNYNFFIEVDGGISLKNIKVPLNKGADVIVTGSGFFDVSINDKKKLIEIIHNY